MKSPKVSVIIPTYNGKEHLSEAIQSVLDQTYQNFELLVVNDASPDDTAGVMVKFDDPRLKYIVHERNLGVDQARSTGIRSSSGEVIALLDQDDFFHPDKLQAHVSFLEQNPDIGFTYNARFELNFSSKSIRDIWRPPRNVELADVVLWFPIAPSDVVLRRDWAFRINREKHDLSWTGGEIAIYGKMMLDGCKFASVNRAYNYRRHHSGRFIRDLAGGCASEINCQKIIFNDPRCPTKVLSLRNRAHANIYMFWAYRAFAQNETELGQKFLREAVLLMPAIITGSPCELVETFMINCADDENLDHAALLNNVFTQFPVEFSNINKQLDWAIKRGYLIKAVRAILWGRLNDGREYFEIAKNLCAEVDHSFLDMLAQKLLDISIEFGDEASQDALQLLSTPIKNIGGKDKVQILGGLYAINRAFESYENQNYDDALKKAYRAISLNPQYLRNRGAISALLKSGYRHILSKLQRSQPL